MQPLELSASALYDDGAVRNKGVRAGGVECESMELSVRFTQGS